MATATGEATAWSMKAVPLNVIEAYVGICFAWASVWYSRHGRTNKRGFQQGVEVVRWPRMDTARMQVLGRLKRNLNHQPHQDLRFIWVMGEGGALELYLDDSACREVVPTFRSVIVM